MKRRNRDQNAGPPLSFQKPASKKAVRYEPHTGKKDETIFEDPRGITYGVDTDGSLRAINKPRSRVKRIRDERRAAAQAREKAKKENRRNADARTEEAGGPERSSTSTN
jgi:hypothetical protein